MSSKMKIWPSSSLHLLSWLQKEKDNFRLTKEVEICFDDDNCFAYKDVVAIANVINENCNRLEKVVLSCRGHSAGEHSTTAFLMASYLVQAIKTVTKELKIRTDLKNQENTSTFLQSTADAITGLSIDRLGGNKRPKLSSQMAKAIASLPSLRQLTLRSSSRTVGNIKSQQEILLECVNQNVIRLENLTIDGKDFAGMGLFLQSPCASGLKEVDLRTSSFDRLDAIELKSGLMQNASVSHLIVTCGNDDDFEGLPVFLDYLKQESSLQTLDVSDEGLRNPNAIFEPLFAVLQTKTNLIELCIDGFQEPIEGQVLRDFLMSNQWLQCLRLTFYGFDSFSDETCACMGQGLRNNTSLSALKLFLDLGDKDPDLTYDLSSIINAVTDPNTPTRLEDLRLWFSDCKVTPSTWTSLENVLQQEQCPLKSIDIAFGFEGRGTTFSFIQAVTNSTSLERATLEFQDILEEQNDDDYYSEAFPLALREGSSSLSHLSLTLDDEKYEELGTEEKKQMLARTLRCMDANTKLESVKLYPLMGDTEFKLGLISYCTRNKAKNTSASLEDLTLDPADLPGILDDIERNCEVLGISTELYFVRIWFSLLVSRPSEAEKYCP